MFNRRDQSRKQAFAEWICSQASFDTFVTLTLKQGLPCEQPGPPVLISRNECAKTARIFRDRISKRLLGSGKVRGGHKMPMAAFVEGGGDKRMHLHMILAAPQINTDLAAFRMLVCDIASRLEWVHKRVDTRPITYGKPEFVAEYCLKEGTDAFLTEASSFPSKS